MMRDNRNTKDEGRGTKDEIRGAWGVGRRAITFTPNAQRPTSYGILICLFVLSASTTAHAKDFYTKDTKVTETKVEAKAEPVKEVVSNVAKVTTKTAQAAVKAPVTAAKAVVEGEPEGLKKLKAIQNQEEWVSKLEKQLASETAQLKEMRTSLAQNFGLDIKKVEKGEYQFDAKSGKFVEK